MKKSNKITEYTEKDYEFMNSLSSAILNSTPSKVSRVLKIWLITILIGLTWASFAEIDEITRGNGKVIPYGQNQIIQNLEGGIVEDILVQEGQVVKAGQVILKINNAKSTSNSTTNKMKVFELKLKALRLYAQANNTKLDLPKSNNVQEQVQIRLERELYLSNTREQRAKDSSIVNQINQKKQEYKEALAKIEI